MSASIEPNDPIYNQLLELINAWQMVSDLHFDEELLYDAIDPDHLAATWEAATTIRKIAEALHDLCDTGMVFGNAGLYAISHAGLARLQAQRRADAAKSAAKGGQ